MDPITLIGAVSGVLNIVDQVSNQLDRFREDKPEPAEEPAHGTIATRERPDTIIVRRHGHEVERITAADLERLDEADQGLIKALEGSMQRNYQIWTMVYPTRNQSADPMVNARVNQQLQDVAKSMCADLERILRYLDSIDKYLEDHYGQVRFVCMELESM